MKNGYSICFNEWALDKSIKGELGLLLIISSLTAEKGYCYATNNYFAELFGIDEVSISRKIKKLEGKGYIEISYTKRGCEVISREIRLTKMLTDDLQKCQSTINKNVKENIINNNIINNNNIKKEKEKEKEKIPIPAELQEAMNLWLGYRQEIKKPYKPIGLKECIRKIQEMSCNDSKRALAIVRQSIVNGWIGLFPIKEDNIRPPNKQKGLLTPEEEESPFASDIFIEKLKKQLESNEEVKDEYSN